MTPGQLLRSLNFRAETSALGASVELAWDLADPASPPDQTPLLILMRERRFPGKSRRGVVPVPATADDLTDGTPVWQTITFRYDFQESVDELNGDLRISTTRQYVYSGQPRDRVLVRSIRSEYSAADSTLRRTTVRAVCRDLTPGTIYYFTAFAGLATKKGMAQWFSRITQSSALATGSDGPAIFSELPPVHQTLDTELPGPLTVANGDQSKGQLQRFLETFELHSSMLYGAIDGLRDLHAVRRADSRVLPALAHLLGWRLKDNLDEDGQRNEIGFASEFYRSVGTIPNLTAMINRLTGWDTRIREFARNVLLSFDSNRVETLQSGTVAYLDGSFRPNDAPPPTMSMRRAPAGSVDTADLNAMYKLRNRTFDDDTPHTWDAGTANSAGDYVLTNDNWYNRQTIGVYIVPNEDADFFTLNQEWERVRQLVMEFLPIQVRPVFLLMPGVILEDPYDATTMIVEEALDAGQFLGEEPYGEGVDERIDTIPGWHWLVANRVTQRSVNTALSPVNTADRSWHTGLAQRI